MATKVEWFPAILRPLLGAAWDVSERWALPRCAAVVAATDSVATRYRALHRELLTVWNYPDLRAFEADRSQVVRGRVIYAGSIDEHRGIDDLIRAFPQIAANVEGAHLHIVPWHSLGRRLALSALIRDLGLDDLVVFDDPMGEVQLREALARSHVAVVPHRDTRAMRTVMPTKLLEYFAMSMPVVLTDLPCHRALLTREWPEAELSAPGPESLAGAVTRLLLDPARCKELGDSARKLVEEKMNWEREGRKLVDLYGRLLAG